MFEFTLIDLPDGNQIIDKKNKTLDSSLTPAQLLEYIEVDSQLSSMERLEKKQKREADQKRKLYKNPLWKLASICGIV